jgi:hypothetical protein
MKKIILFFTTLCCALSLIAQKKYIPKITTILHKLGNDHIQLKISQYGKNKDIVYINLHADETTSIAGAENFLQTRGGLLIKLENANKRNISFRLKGGIHLILTASFHVMESGFLYHSLKILMIRPLKKLKSLRPVF